MNLWCFPWADQICGLLSSRFSWAQSMKNWIKRLTFHSHFIRATEHRPHHQIKTSEGPEMSYIKLPSCCGPCWVQQGYSGDGGQEHPKTSVILASSTSPNCTKSWSNCSCQHALILKSMLSESSLFQFSQRKDNDSHSWMHAGTAGWFKQTKTTYVSQASACEAWYEWLHTLNLLLVWKDSLHFVVVFN